ncbi:HTR-like protein [Haloferax mucosum ATCC BAA-1512]|uniref:histidine kinase n=2 Tax=Haloferax mucosum TaxID=403181 RepID=M0IH50_9EURY|nr:PAS domain-containing sensor histidine kinase [Haloferax mucosum]ELZ95178.1 HTR-like protein [Haloferax mucosum ATCC BAA-1512]
MTLSPSLASSSLDALPTQLAILDAEGVIIYTNQTWREFGNEHGRTDDSSSIGSNYLDICDVSGDKTAMTARDGIRAVARGDRDTFSFEYPCHNENERQWFTMRASRFSVGDEMYIQVIHLDITDRKRAELEVDEKAARLQSVARMLSHDLRNPLSVASGYVDSLLEEGVVPSQLERVANALSRIDEIISDALIFARHDSVNELVTVDLETQAERAWEHVETGDAELVVSDTVVFRADPNLLGHIFENLFRNAIEHGCDTDDCGQLTVTVGPTTGRTGDPGFYVADDGPGVPAEDRDEVFEAGYTTGTDGTGFGLAIVTQTAMAHDWCIELAESVGGSRFEITGLELRADGESE